MHPYGFMAIIRRQVRAYDGLQVTGLGLNVTSDGPMGQVARLASSAALKASVMNTDGAAGS